MSARKTDDYSPHLQPEEIELLMTGKNLIEVAAKTGRAHGVLVSKRQELRNAAIDRRRMPSVFVPDDGMTFAARMSRILRGDK